MRRLYDTQYNHVQMSDKELCDFNLQSTTMYLSNQTDAADETDSLENRGTRIEGNVLSTIENIKYDDLQSFVTCCKEEIFEDVKGDDISTGEMKVLKWKSWEVADGDNCGPKCTVGRNARVNKKVSTPANKRSGAGDQKRYSCHLCSKSFMTICGMKNHVTSHDVNSRHACSHCSKTFTSRNGLLRHKHMKHDNGYKLMYLVCDKTFPNRYRLSQHKKVHASETPFPCPLCESWFADQAGLKRHSEIHSLERLHNCPLCQRRFRSNKALEAHVRTHTGERPFQCSICSKRSSQSGNLRTHLKIHFDDRPFSCHICHKEFIQKSHLDIHLSKHFT